MGTTTDVEWEIGLKPQSSASRESIASRVAALVAAAPAGTTGAAALSADPVLAREVHSARATIVGGAEPWSPAAAAALRKSRPLLALPSAFGSSASERGACRVFVHALYDEGSTEEYTEGMGGSDEESVAWTQTLLPALSLDGHWESLLFDASVKQRLLSYARSALAFSASTVDPHLVSCHRLLLLHGPPGTGKTSLCRALAHKLLARSAGRYAHGSLLELNAHSLFSKWFSESGKLVGAVFGKVRELLDDADAFVAVLLDEVESLAASRAAALNGSEPSDAVRVVNAVLTQLDSLKGYANALVLATSNITAALDAAFADRADLSLYIGLPNDKARYQILASCVRELSRASVVVEFEQPAGFEELDADVGALLRAHGGAEGAHALRTPLDLQAIQRLAQQRGAQREAMSDAHDDDDGDGAARFRMSLMLLMLAQAADGWSGRALRRLPLLAHAEAGVDGPVGYATFLLAMMAAIHARDDEAAKFEPAK